jgi:hypothetical protein
MATMSRSDIVAFRLRPIVRTIDSQVSDVFRQLGCTLQAGAQPAREIDFFVSPSSSVIAKP